jgi:hypothetical protein
MDELTETEQRAKPQISQIAQLTEAEEFSSALGWLKFFRNKKLVAAGISYAFQGVKLCLQKAVSRGH